MKIALVTTTIFVPKVLALYRAYGPDVKFFVMGDLKSDSAPVLKWCRENLECEFYDVVEQKNLNWKCSKLLGWNTITRRNIAILEALKWGADIIVSIDDDNIPVDAAYFADFERALLSPHDGLLATSESGWFDVGQLLDPIASHRGFPHDRIARPVFKPVVGATVGVAAGMCLGNPDIDAATRIVAHPIVHGVSECLRGGIVTDPRRTWTVFNTQNTAYLRALAPAMLCCPQFGRHDDIFAGLVTQRVMREKNLHVHFGRPYVWQERNQHDLIKDLKAEIWGVEHILEFAGCLWDWNGPDRHVANMVSSIYVDCHMEGLISDATMELVLAWEADCLEAMK